MGSQPPNAETDGIFVQNEGTLISGVTSFTTVNFIGTGSGDDIVFATQNSAAPNTVVDVNIISYWIADSNGIHTTRQVGINSAIPRANSQLDIDGRVDIRGDVGIATDLTADGFLDIGSSANITNDLNVGAAATVGFITVTNNALSLVSVRLLDLLISITMLMFRRNKCWRCCNSCWSIYCRRYCNTRGTSIHRSRTDYCRIYNWYNIYSTICEATGVSTFAVSSGIATLAGIGSTAVTVETFTKDNDQFYFLPFVENPVGTFGDELGVDAGIKYNPSTNHLEVVNNLTVGAAITTGSIGVSAGATVGGATTLHSSLQVEGTTLFEDNVEFDSTITDINGSTGVGAGKTDYRLASVGSGVSWRPPGVQTTNLIYVSVDGNDNNSGLLEGDAKAVLVVQQQLHRMETHICTTWNILREQSYWIEN